MHYTSPMLTIALASFLAVGSSALAADHKSNGSATTAPPKIAAAHRPRVSYGYVRDQLLVQFRVGTTDASMAAAHAQLGAKEIRRFTNVAGLTLVQLPAGMSVKEALARYRKRPDVVYAGPNFIRHLKATPNDPYFTQGRLWALQNTGRGG